MLQKTLGRLKDLGTGALARAREAVRTHPLLSLAIAYLAAKQMVVIFAIMQGYYLPPNQLVAVVGGALVVVSWAFVLRGLPRLGALAAVDLATGAVLLTDLTYFRQFADLPSVGSLKHAGLVGELDGLEGILGEIVHPVDVLLFSGTVLLLWVALKRSSLLESGRVRKKLAVQLTVVGVAMVAGVACTTARLKKPFGGHTVVASRLGPIGYHAYDVVTQVGRETLRRLKPTEEELAELRGFMAARPPAKPDPAIHGSAVGKNVIYVQLESWQTFALFRKVNGVEITPNMNRLAEESAYFPNFFAQVQQGTTSDAELLAQCSIYPSRTGSVYYDHAGADFRCLPEVLRERGYRTVAMHGNRPDFWNRAAMYPTVGIERFYDIRDFEDQPLIGLGTADVEFFAEAVEKLKAEPKPFYALLVSITSHNPFNYEDLPRGFLDHDPEFEGTRLANYLDAVHYTDRAIGVLVEKLREANLLDESVLVLYGDHQGVAPDSSNVNEFLGADPADPMRTFLTERHVPGLIRLPHGAHAGVRTRAAGQIDLASTVASLLDVHGEGTAFFGRDLLDGRPGFVAFPHGSVVVDDVLHLSPDGGHGKSGCFAYPSGERLPGERCAAIEQLAEDEIQASWRMLDSGLVAKVAEPATKGQVTTSHP